MRYNIIEYTGEKLQFMNQIYNRIKTSLNLNKQRIAYFFNKTNQVFVCRVDYNTEPYVRFGMIDLKEPYEEEKEVDDGIFSRKLKDGNTVYVTHVKGKYCMAVNGAIGISDYAILAYRPRQWSLRSRDRMLAKLFIETICTVMAVEEIIEEEHEKGNLSLEQMNAHIRISNIVRFEIDKLMEQYCYCWI